MIRGQNVLPKSASFRAAARKCSRTQTWWDDVGRITRLRFICLSRPWLMLLLLPRMRWRRRRRYRRLTGVPRGGVVKSVEGHPRGAAAALPRHWRIKRLLDVARGRRRGGIEGHRPAALRALRCGDEALEDSTTWQSTALSSATPSGKSIPFTDGLHAPTARGRSSAS